ncbi:hypothetical protein VCHENC03_2280A, partial [Vibrio sp. HENC-03]
MNIRTTWKLGWETN